MLPKPADRKNQSETDFKHHGSDTVTVLSSVISKHYLVEFDPLGLDNIDRLVSEYPACLFNNSQLHCILS